VTVTPNPETETPDTDGVTRAAQSVTATPAGATPADEVRRVAERRGVPTAEVVRPLRDVVRALAGDASLCDWCEDPLPEHVISNGGRYCSKNHRKEASRRRVTRRREFAARAKRGETQGSCDRCGATCHIENALCDACIDDLHESARDAMTDEQTRKDNL